jgi:ribonuclease HI
MECSFRGLPTKGDRSVLISRLMKVIDGDEYKQDEVTEPPSLDAAQVYVLRVKGHTTPNSSGVGIGLVLYDPVNNKELWSGRIYSSGDRAGFEAEYSAIIVGLDFAKTYGIQKLTVQSSNDAIVCQINGLYKVNKTALQRMLKIEKAMEESFSDFSIEEIASGENVKASEMAKKALATRKSLNIPDSWKFDDPIEAVEQDPEDPEEPMRNEPDEPALDAVIDPSRIYLLRFDGGSRGNPGIAGAGMVLYDDQGQEIW